MIFTPSLQFKKQLKKFNLKERTKFYERMEIFILDEHDQVLNNHKLHGEYEGYRSLNITGNIRVIYKRKSDDEVILYRIGTHSELYT